MIQQIKDYLVSLGPRNSLTRLSLRLHGKQNGFAIAFPNDTISICRDSCELILHEKDFYLVPITLECFDQTFGDIEPKLKGNTKVLDFSTVGSHRYKRHGISLSFPGAPEDDSIAAYTLWHTPRPGELIFDMGAHAGFTTCMFARMVGPSGRVIAFEPDSASLQFLKKNLSDHHITNVTIVDKAVDAKTGTAYFNADGTMRAGLVAHTVYSETGRRVEVETLSFENACSEFGVPSFVKMDIEGAEVAVIESSPELLKQNSIDMAFDSYHRMRDGRFTWMLLEPMLRSMGYEVKSSAEFGQMFTWAKKSSS